MGKALLVASGKGGVGKSTITACLGIALARMTFRVCIIDVDIGLRDQDAILGLENRIVYDVVDVCNKACSLDQALVSPMETPGLQLLPAAQIARCKDLDQKAFRHVLRELKDTNDFVLIDCPAGVERGLRGVLSAEIDDALLICTPDDVCIRDAEQVCGLLAKRELPRPQLIVNRLMPELIEAGEMYAAQVVADTLDLTLLGEVPEDSSVYRALLRHLSPMELDCPGQEALTRIARRIAGEAVPLPDYGKAKRGWFDRLRRRRVKEVKRLDR